MDDVQKPIDSGSLEDIPHWGLEKCLDCPQVKSLVAERDKLKEAIQQAYMNGYENGWYQSNFHKGFNPLDGVSEEQWNKSAFKDDLERDLEEKHEH